MGGKREVYHVNSSVAEGVNIRDGGLGPVGGLLLQQEEAVD